MDRVHSGLSASIPSEGQSPSTARLVAELQALMLALHIGGLDGLRSGEVKFTPTTQKEAGDE